MRVEDLRVALRRLTAKCLNCSSCVSVCPLAPVTGLNPRRLVLAARRGDGASSSVWECTQCSLCSAACPQGIDVSLVISLLRRLEASRKLMPDTLRNVVAEVSRRGLSTPPLRPSEYSVSSSASPVFKAMGMAEELGLAPAESGVASSAFKWGLSRLRRASGRVLLYPGCMALNVVPGITYSCVRALEDLGLEVVVDGERFHCCGLPLIAVGECSPTLIALLACSTIGRAVEADASAVVTPCNGCLSMLLLGLGLARGSGVVREAVEREAERLGVTVSWELPVLNVSDLLAPSASELGVSVGGEHMTPYYGCHYTVLSMLAGLKPSSLDQVLSLIDAEAVRIGGENMCCGGFAKTDMRLVHELSEAVVRDAYESGASLVVTHCTGCTVNLDAAALSVVEIEESEAALPVHVAQLLTLLKHPEEAEMALRGLNVSYLIAERLRRASS